MCFWHCNANGTPQCERKEGMDKAECQQAQEDQLAKAQEKHRKEEQDQLLAIWQQEDSRTMVALWIQEGCSVQEIQMLAHAMFLS